jgi:Uma2 family endonuclease
MVIEKKRITYDDYEAFISRPENADHIFELIDGEIVEKMPSYEPSHIAGWILTFLNMYLLRNDVGYTTTADGGYIMPDENILIPDVGYISRVRMPEKPPREVPTYPDFVVEVKSPTDSKRSLRRKAEKYLEYGTRLVWLVFPDEKQVEVYSLLEEDVITLGLDGVLDGKDVLPDFSLAVKDIFK